MKGNLEPAPKFQRLEGVPSDKLDDICWELMRRQRRKYLGASEKLAKKRKEERKRKAGAIFTVEDVKNIVFPEGGGRVKRVDVTKGLEIENSGPL